MLRPEQWQEVSRVAAQEARGEKAEARDERRAASPLLLPLPLAKQIYPLALVLRHVLRRSTRPNFHSARRRRILRLLLVGLKRHLDSTRAMSGENNPAADGMGVPALPDPTTHGDPSAPHGDPSAPDADFSPEKWVCLFPAATPPFRPLLPDEEAGEAGGDPAAEFRGAHPVTFETMLADFDDPVLRMFAFLGASRSASFLGWRSAAQVGLCYCMMLAFQGLSWSWNDGLFGTKQMVAGVVSATALGFFAIGLVAVAMPSVPKVLDFAAPAVLCRWLQLTRKEEGPKPGRGSFDGSLFLVAHEEGDRFCPCSGCVGNIQRLAACMTFLDIVYNFLFSFLFTFTAGWTTWITFGSKLLSTWWGCVLGAIYICVAVASFMNSAARFVGVTNVASARLEARLHHRAVVLSMRSMLQTALGDRPTGSEPWLYVRLHHGFAAWCKVREMQDQTLLSNSVFVIMFPLIVITIIVNVGVGSCIPAWLLFCLSIVLVYMLINAINLASRNNLISVVASAYHDARRDLRTACLKLGPTPLAAALEQHDRVIGSFLEVSRYSAKILGFTVTYGGVRTMVVTMVTLSVALWSVFRSLGVFFTMESFCPLVD